ncbi:MAG TPA: M23 family metallopeptidase [Pseudomonadota bacterium]|nr:M23 family metallopeptidase [Pseudomonadota bacterium]
MRDPQTPKEAPPIGAHSPRWRGLALLGVVSALFGLQLASGRLAAAAGDAGGVVDAGPTVDAGGSSSDAGSRPDGGTSDGGASAVAGGPPPPMPPIIEPPSPPLPALARRAKVVRGKPGKPTSPAPDVHLENQNLLQGVARRYAQLLLSRRFDEAFLMHEEAGGRRPNWTSLRGSTQSFLDAHGPPTTIEQSITVNIGAELTTFYFTARFSDGAELPLRIALDYWGHVSGAGVGSEIIPAMRQRYDRNDGYKTRTVLSLPFAGVWTASNATLGPGNGHYLNANQRFAIDFFITEELEPGKRKASRPPGKQNSDYFAFGQDVLAPADAVVVQVVDGIPDNPPGQVDVYYRLGNTVVLSFENGEFAYLCHLMSGSLRVRPGDRVTRGQVLGKCGNSGNSTGPHLHFQLTDGPLITYSTSLPAYFHNVRRNGTQLTDVLPQSGDRLENVQVGRPEKEKRGGDKPRASLGPASAAGKRRRHSG